MITAEEQRLIDLAVAAAPPLISTQARLVRDVIKPHEWDEPSPSALDALLQQAPMKQMGRAA